jgi:hypothetical protein
MALLLQKQDEPAKDATTPTITAHSCSSSSEGGSPSHELNQRAGSPGAGASGKSSKVASLLRSISGKALRRTKSGKRADTQAHGVNDAVDAVSQQIQQQAGATEDLMEAGVLGQAGGFGATAGPAAAATAGAEAGAAAAAMPHSASAPGPLGPTPGAPSEPTPAPHVSTSATAAAAAAAAAVTAVVLAKGSGGLGRPSAASLWREAGWDAAGGVPVGIITLEDVLEELMQVCVGVVRLNFTNLMHNSEHISTLDTPLAACVLGRGVLGEGCVCGGGGKHMVVACGLSLGMVCGASPWRICLWLSFALCPVIHTFTSCCPTWCCTAPPASCISFHTHCSTPCCPALPCRALHCTALHYPALLSS